MNDLSKKKEPLIAELATLQQQVVDLEKKAAEYQCVLDALRVSEIRYRRLFETAQDGILILDAETGKITDVNPFLVKILGYTHGELLGETLWEVGPFKNVKASKDAFSELQTKGYVRYENLPLETRDGKSIEVEFVSNVYDVDHKKVIQCNIRNITERKRVEELLREKEERYRSLFENMANGFAYCRMLFEGDRPQDFIYLAVNDAFEKLTGLKDVIGKRVTEVIPGMKESNPELFEICGRVALGGKPERFETYLEPLDEWFSVSMYSPEKGCFVAVFEVITRRKCAEEEQRLNMERLRLALDASDSGVWEWDLRSNENVWSEELWKVYGLEPQSCKPSYEAWRQTVLADDRAKAEHAVQEAARKGTELNAEWRVHGLDGTERWLMSRGHPIHDAAGHVERFIGIVTDITELKQSEEALKESEGTARKLALENETIASIGRIASSTLTDQEIYQGFGQEAKKIIHFDRIVISVIDIGKDMIKHVYIAGEGVPEREAGMILPLHGSASGEMARTKSTLLIQTEDFHEYKDRFPRLLLTFQAGFRSILNVPLFSKGEVIGGLLLRSRKPYAYTDKDVRVAEKVADQIAGAVANAQLFAESRRVEGALRESEQKFRELYDYAPVGYHEYDLEGTITNVNRTELEMLGYEAEEIIGQPVWKLVGEEGIARERVLSKLAGILPPDENLERNYRKKDGTTLPVLVMNRLILDEKGEIKGMRCTVQDMTQRKQAEGEKARLLDQLQQAQKMEAIGTLAGGIAHDFNNILTAIMGYTELADLDLAEESNAKRNLRESIKSAHRAKELVKQILAFSRQGKQERKPLDIRPIVKEGLKFLRASLPSTIEVRQSFEGDLPIIEADPTQVYQILMNLCTNAAHAMEEKGGVLEVSLEQFIQIPGNSAINAGIEPGPYLKLRVSDTGHGIPPDILPRIFEPYFTTKGVGKGTGLGLAVVHGIVKSDGGGIAVSSELGKGTTVEVYFPRVKSPKAHLTAEQREPLPLGGHEKILFVDDEAGITEIARGMLEHLGYEVEVRTSSIEAREVFRANPDRFDLVITDMTMPNMTGDRLAQEIFGIRPGTPIILCTGFSELITEEKAKALGIQEFVMKPLVMKDLAVVIRRALERKKKKRR